MFNNSDNDLDEKKNPNDHLKSLNKATPHPSFDSILTFSINSLTLVSANPNEVFN